MGKIITVVSVIMCLAWVLYCNTGARRVCAEVEVLIEQQCRTFAECRVTSDGTAVKCWAINANEDVELWRVGSELPTYGDIEVFCNELRVVEMSI